MLDGGPSRVPQPIERRNMYRSSPEAYRRPTGDSPQPQPEAPEPKRPVSRSVSSARPAKPKAPFYRSKAFFIVLALVALLAIGGWFAWTKFGTDSGQVIDTSRHQAVFFANGQVYFGKLEFLDNDYLKLSDVFYIKSNSSESTGGQNPQQGDAGSLQLIKLGDEVHGPEDAMIINRDQLLFFENLKSDGRVTQLISEFKAGKG